MAFEARHLDLQFYAALTDRHRLVMQQPEGLDFFFLGAPARVTDTLQLALTASGCASARIVHKPRLLPKRYCT